MDFHILNNEIKTERLKLRSLAQKDANRFIEIAKNMRAKKENNPNYFLYVRFDYDVVKTDADLKKAVIELLISAEKAVFPETTKRLSIRLNNGHIIGYIGFSYNPQNTINSDLGVFLDPQYEHKGFAFEAQKSLLAYYFLNVNDKIYLTIHPKNIPSYKLNIKCGAVKIAHTDESKYGTERDILVITRKKFIETVFNIKFRTNEEEKQYLLDYLKIYNKL